MTKVSVKCPRNVWNMNEVNSWEAALYTTVFGRTITGCQFGTLWTNVMEAIDIYKEWRAKFITSITKCYFVVTSVLVGIN